MKVRPVPVARVGSGDPARTWLPALAPVLALVLVVAAAWAGALPRGEVPADPVASAPGDGWDGVPGAGPASGDRPGRAAADPSGRGLDGFPSEALGLSIMSGPELLDARAAGQVRGELVAVAGVLRIDPLTLTCPAIRLTLSRTFCRRMAAFFPDVASASAGAAAAHAADGAAAGPPEQAFLAQVLPGTPIPAILPAASELAPWLPGAIRTVVVGHFEDARAPGCEAGRDWCADDFVVERLVWLDGSWVDLIGVRDPRIPETAAPFDGDRAKEIALRTAARGEQILGQAILGARLLAVVDPQAAATVGADMGDGAWYTRSVVGPRPGRAPEVIWTLFDDRSGRVLGSSAAQP